MDNYLGEIRLFPYNQQVRGWLPCNGQTLQIQSNNALYALIGITYGGDGVKTFNIPNLNGRVIIGAGRNAVSGTIYETGVSGGYEAITLSQQNFPFHSHALSASTAYDQITPIDNVLANPNVKSATSTKTNAKKSLLYAPYVQSSGDTMVPLSPASIGPVGGAPHENRMPYMGMVYCIATLGYWPPRP